MKNIEIFKVIYIEIFLGELLLRQLDLKAATRMI